MANIINIRRDRYVILIQSTAQLYGAAAARAGLQDRSIPHPGDPLGNLLSDVWLVQDEPDDLVPFVMVGYMAGLRREYEAAGATPPKLEEMLHGLPLAINETRYPGVDVSALMRVLRRQTPRMFGDPNL
jgi:hypothetical protein